jgi:hypothetical protein
MTVAEFSFAIVGGALIGAIIAAIILPPLLVLFGWWLDFWFGS